MLKHEIVIEFNGEYMFLFHLYGYCSLEPMLIFEHTHTRVHNNFYVQTFYLHAQFNRQSMCAPSKYLILQSESSQVCQDIVLNFSLGFVNHNRSVYILVIYEIGALELRMQ